MTENSLNVIPFRPEPAEVLTAEQAVIGAALLDPTRIPALAEVLGDPGVFYRPAHETIWRTITRMSMAGRPVDPLLLTDVLHAQGDLNKVGGPGYLHTCIAATPTAANGEYYADLVRAGAERRRINTTTSRLAHLAGDQHADLADVRTAALAALADLASGETWLAPVPLDSHGALPTFPVHALPDWVGAYVEAVAEFTQTPPDMAATMALAALSTAAGGRVNVEIRPGWREQSNLYLVCAMPPASRKSDVFAFMTGPVYRVEDELQAGAKMAIIEAQTAKETALAEVEALMHKARKNPDLDRAHLVAEISAARMVAEEIAVPPTPRLTMSGDLTPETVTHHLGVHRCLAALSPEGDLFDSIAGRYSSKPNLGVFLQAHKGERLQTDRITREQPTVDKPALTIGVTPQPAVLQELGAAPGARDRGLLARFLYSLPPSNLGYRKIRTTPIPDATATTYDVRLTALLHTLTALDEPVTVTMTDAADLAIEKLQERYEVQLRPDEPLAHIKDWAGKLVGHIARIATLLHLADHTAVDWRAPVQPATVDRAAEIAEYYTAHTLAVFDLIAADPATDDAHALLQWLQRPRKDGTHRTHIKAHDAVASSRRFKKVADVEPALQLLEQHGWLRSDQPPASGQRGRPQAVTYRVHPVASTPTGTDATR
ncbi:DUF3987 domain-containing protein [Streptomyces sp. CB01881]|uniref:DUF3987 domain-containing protein n=1 Tax=Streptomyces sp. CB01881 TaxID=2078691 RepID=UPI000CDC740F|nr:DUF3987 domain-containing protein [Streptomyces sp. CB01881]AUY51260.1 hypothetical protein C2142_22580 [Streptomyces sp. CB01881]TYC74646.1 DUF3987 domain-containing protein [Streptomyces sp. CB01881]